MKILVVEDDTLIREGLSEFLSESGYSIVQAKDGKEALEKFNTDIHLVILDIQIPYINGLDVLKEIRKESDLPVLILTAFSNEEFKIDAYTNLADGYIEKPHTSSGRVPSSKGYRYYIEHLRSANDKANLIKDRLNKFIDENGKVMHTDQIIDECCQIISNMTNLVSVVMGPDSKDETIAKIELIPLNSFTAIVVFITNSGYVEHKTITLSNESQIEELQDCIKIINKRIFGVQLSQIDSVLDGIQLVLSEHIKNYESVYNAFANTFLKFAKERVSYYGKNGTELLSGESVQDGESITVSPWNIKIVEEA
mgnify:CR=1 FL=1